MSIHREDEVCTETPRACSECGDETCMRCRAFHDIDDVCDGCNTEMHRASERRADGVLS